MKLLSKPSDNLGGLLSLWAVPPADLTIGFNVVSFLTTDNTIQIYCSPGSLSFTEKETKEKFGTVYNAELKAFIPKDSPEARNIIDQMSRRKWVVIILDQNEQFKVSGTPDIPLRVSFDMDTGSDPSERNGYIVSFYGKQITRSLFITNPFIE